MFVAVPSITLTSWPSIVRLVTLAFAPPALAAMASRKEPGTGTPGNAIASSNPSFVPDFFTWRAPTWTIDAIAPRLALRPVSNWAAWVASSGASVYGAAIDSVAAGSAPGELATADDAVAAGVADAPAAGDGVVAAAGDMDAEVVGTEVLPQAPASSAIAASPANARR